MRSIRRWLRSSRRFLWSCAAPTLIMRIFPGPAARNSWDAAQGEWLFGEWLLARWNDPVRTLAWARLPMLLVTLFLGWMIFVGARKLGGDWGGLLSLSAYVSTPAFIVFGPLVLTDIAVTLFCLLTLWQ